MTVCAKCGQENPAGAKFCNNCAAPLTAAAGLPEERRIVTILFADLVGFTARAERLDPEDVRAFLSPYFARVRAEIEARGGVVEKFIGDAVMAVFGAPVAHGDDPERAVRAALAICTAVGDLNSSDPELDLQLRVAVNTGEALVTLAAGGGEGMVAGDVVNTASRMQSAAPVNGVLVGEETYRATRSIIEYADFDAIAAKGKEQPVRVWRVVAELASPGERAQMSVPMLGRETELSALTGIWSRVVSERRPQFVTIFGPAGIGKTRLSAEFAELAGEDARVIRGRSLPYGEMTPYGAFAAQVKQIARIFDTDPIEAAIAKLDTTVRELVDGADGETASHIGMLIGVGTEGGVGDRQTLFFSARRLIEALALKQPLVLVFEDIHLSSASMLDLLEMLASRVRDVPLLLLAQARPELLEARPVWGGGLPAYTALQLEPLPADHSQELARRLLEAAGAEGERAETLAGTAEGNPLFIEELASSVAEQTSQGEGDLPSGVRSIIAARLDALPATERDVLLDASVVGKVFWSGAVARMAGDEAARLEALDELERRDLIRRDPVSRLQGQQQFAFKHQLIYEVAYATLPRALRRERHAKIASFLEDAVAETGDVAPALAHHWREAGETQRAVGYLLAGADQANRGWAKEEAVRLYSQALELVAPDDERRREIAMQLAVAAQAAYHVIDAERLARHARPQS
jgi:class 3 adenylate cyclase